MEILKTFFKKITCCRPKFCTSKDSNFIHGWLRRYDKKKFGHLRKIYHRQNAINAMKISYQMNSMKIWFDDQTRDPEKKILSKNCWWLSSVVKPIFFSTKSQYSQYSEIFRIFSEKSSFVAHGLEEENSLSGFSDLQI